MQFKEKNVYVIGKHDLINYIKLLFNFRFHSKLRLDPLRHSVSKKHHLTKILDFKIRSDHGKISYERRVYESVDDSS